MALQDLLHLVQVTFDLEQWEVSWRGAAPAGRSLGNRGSWRDEKVAAGEEPCRLGFVQSELML